MDRFQAKLVIDKAMESLDTEHYNQSDMPSDECLHKAFQILTSQPKEISSKIILALLRLRWDNGSSVAQSFLKTISPDYILLAIQTMTIFDRIHLLNGLLVPGRQYLACESDEVNLGIKIIRRSWQTLTYCIRASHISNSFNRLLNETEVNQIELICKSREFEHDDDEGEVFTPQLKNMVPLSPKLLAYLVKTQKIKGNEKIKHQIESLLHRACFSRTPLLAKPPRPPKFDLTFHKDGETDYVIHCPKNPDHGIDKSVEIRIRRMHWGWLVLMNSSIIMPFESRPLEAEGGPTELSRLLQIALGILSEKWYESCAWLPIGTPDAFFRLPKKLLYFLAKNRDPLTEEPPHQVPEIGRHLAAVHRRIMNVIADDVEKKPWDSNVLAVWNAILPIPYNKHQRWYSTHNFQLLHDKRFWEDPFLCKNVIHLPAARKNVRYLIFYGLNFDCLIRYGWQGVCSYNGIPQSDQ